MNQCSNIKIGLPEIIGGRRKRSEAITELLLPVCRQKVLEDGNQN